MAGIRLGQGVELHRHCHRTRLRPLARLRDTLIAATLFIAAPAVAQDATWLANPGSADFTTAANWTPATVPTGVAIFGNSTITTLTFSGSRNLDTFQFNSAAPAYTFNLTSGFGIRFNGDGIVNSSSNAPTLNVASSPLRFDNSSTAGNAIINLASGTVEFLGNSHAGAAQLNAAAGSNFDFTVTTGPGGLGQISAGSISGAGNFDLGSNRLTVGSNNLSTTVSGVISGPAGGALVKIGTGTLTLSAANTYTGGTTVQAGTVAISHVDGSNLFDALGTGDVTLSGGALRGVITGSLANNLTFSANTTSTLSAAAGTMLTLGGDPNTTGNQNTGFTMGANAVAVFGSTTDTGTIRVNASSLPPVVDSTSAVVVAGGTLQDLQTSLWQVLGFTGSVTVNAGATVDYNDAALQIINNLNGAGNVATGLVNNNTLVLLGDRTNVFSGVISGSHPVMFDGGTMILTGDNTYTGGTTICFCSTLQIGSGGTTGSILGDVNNGGTLIFNRSNSFTFSGVIRDDGPDAGIVVQAGTGTTILTGINTYSGGTHFNAGKLSVGSDANLGDVSGALTFNGGVLQVTGTTFNSTARTINWGTAGGGFDIADAGNTFTLSQVLGGLGGLSKLGAGTLVLTGTNTYSGGTAVAEGTLRAGAADVFSSASAFTVAAGATLDLNSFNQTIGSLAGAGNVTLGSAALTAGGDNTSSNFSGVVSGSGGFTKAGLGTLILSGDNVYTGGTTVSGGTLQLGSGGTTGSLLGDIALNGGSMAVNRSNATTLAGVISGTGAFSQTGTGTTTLTAINSYTGSTGVFAGGLIVNGSIASSDLLSVFSGGFVGGTGTLGNTIINGGSLSPGNSIGTIAVNGGLTFVGAGNYVVEVSPTDADRTNVTGTPGTATLAGTLRAVGTGGSYTIGTRYTVLNATGGVSGTFGSLAVSGNFGFTRPHVEYDGNNVYLVLDRALITPFLVNGTANQSAIAAAVDAALIGGSQAAPFAALVALDSAQLPAALNVLSGEVHASTAGVLVDESLYVRSAILGRLRQASYGGDAGMASLSMGGPQTSFVDEELNAALGYAKSPIVTKAPLFAPAPSRDIVFWSQGFGAWGKFNSDGNAAALNRDLAGFITGFDARFGNWRGGIAAGYTGSRNNTDGRGSANVDTGHVAAYGGVSVGALNLRAGGAYAFHTIDTDRSIAFPGFFDRATAHYQGGTGQIFGEAGYGFAFGKLAVEPFAGAAWVRLDTDAFSEKGGAAALNVAANSFEVGYSTLGARAASLVPLDNGMVLIPRASAAWQHAFNSVTPDATVAFQNIAGSFVVAGVPIARDSLLAEAGLDLAINRNATIGVSYTGQIAGNVQDHGAKGKFSWKF